jgi:hypothetical protein
MYYVIQENLFKERHYQLLIDLMERYGFEHEIVKLIPFVHDIQFKTQRKDVFCFGSVSMSKVAKRYGWNPGSLMNENHDFDVYSKQYGLENMLNGDGVVINFSDPLPFDNDEFFARPTEDSKLFTGQVFSRKAWEEYTQTASERESVNVATDDTKILLAPVKYIQQEVRCWVVGGKVVTASRYKLGNRVVYENYDNESFFIDYAQKMVDIYQPAEAFVLDICLLKDELKIVEVNNINSAGFYDCNMMKLITALEKHFNK